MKNNGPRVVPFPEKLWCNKSCEKTKGRKEKKMKQYTEPIVEILAFDAGDIIVTSPKGEDWTTPEQ